jgi:hypothetical protein
MPGMPFFQSSPTNCQTENNDEPVQAEDKIGTMLPCHGIAQQRNGKTEVAAIDPVASMQAVDNHALAPVANEAREQLKAAIESL